MANDAIDDITGFLRQVTTAMGLAITTEVIDTGNGSHIEIAGDNADVLLWHRAEPLKALQHLVDSAFGRRLKDDERVFLDCLGYRKGKDQELRQMALFLAGKVRQTGADQELGPLNPYERRIVHMAVAEEPGVATESVGDAHLKTVIISVKR